MKETGQIMYRERILRVLLHIEAHQDEPLPLEELARVANFSPFHFHRIFSGMVGETVKEYVRRLRLERAAAQLRASRQSILRIALEAGFETHESFTRAFQAMFGEPPSRYRGRCRVEAAAGWTVTQRGPDGWPVIPGRLERRAMEVHIRKLEPMRVAFVRHVGPYEQVHEAWNRLCGWAGRKGLLGPATVCVGLSYDDPEVTPPDKLRYDAAIQVGPGVAGPGPAPSLEFYRNSPQTAKPEDLLTEVWVPLA